MATPQPTPPRGKQHSPSLAPATALRESMLLAGRRVPLSDLSSARQGGVRPGPGTPTPERPPPHPKLTPVLSPPGEFPLGLMARATQIEDRSPLPDLQRPFPPGGNGEVTGVDLQVSAGGGREGALLVLCDLNDGVIGPELRGAVASLQDARQVVGQRPGHQVLGAARCPEPWKGPPSTLQLPTWERRGAVTKNRTEGSGHPAPSHLPAHQLGVDLEAPGLAPQGGLSLRDKRGQRSRDTGL